MAAVSAGTGAGAAVSTTGAGAAVSFAGAAGRGTACASDTRAVRRSRGDGCGSPRVTGAAAGAVLLPRYGGRCGGAGKPVPDGNGRFVRYGRGRLRTRCGNHSGGRFLKRAGAAGDGSFHKAAVFALWRAVDFRNAVRRGTGAFRFRLGARDCHGIIWLLRHLGVVAAVRLGEYLVRRRTLRLGTARRGVRRACRLDRPRPCRAVLHGPGCLDRLRPRCPGLRGPGRLRARLGTAGRRSACVPSADWPDVRRAGTGARSGKRPRQSGSCTDGGFRLRGRTPAGCGGALNGVALGLRRGGAERVPGGSLPAAAEQDRKPSLFPSSIASAGQPSHLTFPCILRAREKKGCRGSFPRQPVPSRVPAFPRRFCAVRRKPSSYYYRMPRRCLSNPARGQKKVRPEGRTENQIDLSSGCKAVAAVDRTVLSGLERNLAGLSALSADSVEHLAGAAGFASGRLAGGTAGLASLGLVGEALSPRRTPAHRR